MLLAIDTHEERKLTLEAAIDTANLCNVVDALAEVCHGKASHLRECWPEAEAEARAWNKAARKLEKLAALTEYPWLI